MRRTSSTALASAAVLFLMAAGCGGSSNKNPTGPGGGGAADVTISILSGSMNAGPNAYSPDTATVQAGQTVKWVNNDAMTHTATPDVSGSFTNTGNITGGNSSAVITISGATGVRAYHCAIAGHNMQGWIKVTP